MRPTVDPASALNLYSHGTAQLSEAHLRANDPNSNLVTITHTLAADAHSSFSIGKGGGSVTQFT